MKKNYLWIRNSLMLFFIVAFSYSSFACNYQLKMYDTYGDGWNGGKVTVFVNGTAVLTDQTVASGYGPLYVTFAASTGDLITTDYTSGTYSSENEYFILDASGSTIASQGTGGVTPGDITTALVAACPVNLDAGMNEVIVNGTFVGSYPVKAILKNYGIDTLFTATINWSVNGVSQTAVSYSDTIITNASDTVLLGSFTFSAGPNSIISYSSAPNSGTDGNNANDTIINVIYIIGSHAFPLYEDFDSATFKFANATGNTVDFIDETTIVHSGTHSRSCAYTSSNVNILHETGMLDLSSTSYPIFEFWHIAKTENNYDKCYIEISTDGGATYVTLDDSLYSGGSSNYATKGYFDESGYADWIGTTPANTWWMKESFDLAPFKQDSVRIRFRMTSDGSVERSGWFIDDISVKEQPANELAIVEVLGKYGGFDVTSTETVSVVVKNNGVLTQASIPMKYTLDNGTVVSETMTTLAAFSLDTFTFVTTYDATTVAVHTLSIYTDLVIDEDRTNDTMTLSFVTNDTTIVPSSFDFDSVPDLHFMLVDQNNSTVLYDIASNNGAGYGIHMYGGATAWSSNPTTVTGAFAFTDHVASVDALVDATGSSNLFVDFDYKEFYSFGPSYTWLRVLINDSIYAKSLAGDSVWNPTTGTTDPWSTITLNLDSFAGTIFSISFQGAMKYNSGYAGYVNGDAIYIDNINYYVPPQNDLSVSALLSPVSTLCGDAATVVEVIVENKGMSAQNNVLVTAIITTPTGMDTVTGTSGVIPVFGSDTVLLSTFDATAEGTYLVTSFASLVSDQNNSNDTLNTSFTITELLAVDFIDGFEGSPLNWANSGFNVNAIHGKTGNGLYKNFYSGSQTGNATMTKKIGPIPSGASLTFDYRIVNWSGYPNIVTTLDADSFFFMLSTDCGTTYDTVYVVDSINHTNSTSWANRQIALTSYAGQSVLLKIDVKYAAGDYYFDVDNIGIATPPTVDLGGDKVICGTETITIDAGNNTTYTYLWTVDNDTLVATTSSIQTDSVGVYTVEVNSPMGMAFDTINVTAAAMPTINVVSVDTMCFGDSSAVIINFTGASPWEFGITDGVNSFSDTSSFMAYTGYPDPDTTTTYVITSLVDGNGCTVTGNLDTAIVVVNALPTFFTTSMGDTICAGDSTILNLSFTGASPWSFDVNSGGVTVGFVTPIASIQEYVSPMVTTNYKVTSVTDGNGCSISGDIDSVLVVVDALPNVGFSTSFGPYCANGVVDTISAYPAGGIFTGTGMTDSIFDPMTAGVGDHQITYSYTDVNTQCSSSVMDTAAVVATPVLSVSNDTTICEGVNITVSAYTNDANDTYLWSTGASTSSINVMPTVDTTYFVTASNGLCAEMDSVYIMVNSTPMVNLGPDTSFKWAYESITLDAGNPSATWLWSTGGTSQTETFDNSNLNKGPNTVFVDVTENNCLATDSVVIMVIDDVSIEGSLSNVNLKVYPNPSNGQFNMTINGFEGNAEMSIVDLSGQIVYTEKLNVDANYVNKFDLHSLATGVYYIKLTTNKGTKVEKLVIK